MRYLIVTCLIIMLVLNGYEYLKEWANKPTNQEIKQQYRKVGY